MSDKKSVVQVNPIFQPTQSLLEEQYTVHRLWEAQDKTAFLAGIADEVTGIVTDGGSGASADLLRQLPNVGAVTVFGVGVDAVDLDYCKARGIRVGNTPDVLTEDVADLAIALALGSFRQLAFAHNYTCAGRWIKDGAAPLTRKFSNSHIGIFGLGRIGAAIATRAEGFGCQISYCNRNERSDVPYQYFSDLKSMAEAVDCLIIGVAPTPDMRGVVNAEVLTALGANGHLVNISRGWVVNEADLVDALVHNKLGGAGLDVFEDEPNVPEALLSLPNVVLQPHVASGTVETRTAMGNLMLENLQQYYLGNELTAFVA
jgi:lactate dehydrogenase-like 2-hydroxyacid dehydrogenase